MTVIGHACGRGAAAHRLGVAGQDCSRAGAGQGGGTEGLTVERSSLVAGSVWRVLDSARCGFTGQGMESSVPFRTTLARHSLWPCGLVSPPQREPCDSLLRRESRWQLNEKVQKGSTKHLDLGGSAVELRLLSTSRAHRSQSVAFLRRPPQESISAVSHGLWAGYLFVALYSHPLATPTRASRFYMICTATLEAQNSHSFAVDGVYLASA